MNSCEDFYEECDCAECCLGFDYLRGYQGNRGPSASIENIRGFQGFIGPEFEAPSGDNGPQGRACSCAGYQGDDGDLGLQGHPLAGPQGHLGSQGIAYRGVQGMQGISGTMGYAGDTFGPQGFDGADLQGPNGIQGDPGFDNNGAQGMQGYQGLRILFSAPFYVDVLGDPFFYAFVDIHQRDLSAAATLLVNMNLSIISTVQQNFVLTVLEGNHVINERNVSFDNYNIGQHQIINFDFFLSQQTVLSFSYPASVTIAQGNCIVQRIGGSNVDPVD